MLKFACNGADMIARRNKGAPRNCIEIRGDTFEQKKRNGSHRAIVVEIGPNRHGLKGFFTKTYRFLRYFDLCDCSKFSYWSFLISQELIFRANRCRKTISRPKKKLYILDKYIFSSLTCKNRIHCPRTIRCTMFSHDSFAA